MQIGKKILFDSDSSGTLGSTVGSDRKTKGDIIERRSVRMHISSLIKRNLWRSRLSVDDYKYLHATKDTLE